MGGAQGHDMSPKGCLLERGGYDFRDGVQRYAKGAFKTKQGSPSKSKRVVVIR